ncbi:YafQ family addiction module toxin [Helicobacter pylori]|uniref:YafQ family addiction module toxin n=1 Tax=Helicobacter pylori TaxID=210 RepID=UPI0019328B4E|nr:YafQ family addiction module toxin [Helicobacter pylori]MBS3015777.1 YafQ family addiction module toxin [Helicobacter pylori]WQR85619.1 YafQ family addiction module toxin [Helicobacter pylori]
MLMIETSKKFDKDLKILVKNGFDLKLLYKVVENLAKEQPLEPKYKDHPLKGALKDFRECHLKPDLLLVYQIKKQENTLAQVYKAINKLSQIEWFKKSVRDIRAFKVEDFSDFTEIVKS